MFSTVQHVLRHINQSVDAGSPLETLRALQKTDGNLPFPYLEAEDYQLALDQEKEEGLPKNTIVSHCIPLHTYNTMYSLVIHLPTYTDLQVIYSGLQRSLCDTLLDKMRYLIGIPSNNKTTFCIPHRAGAYLLRQSTNLTNEDFVFSFK